MQTGIEREYAVALYSIASDDKAETLVYESLIRLGEVFSSCPEAIEILDSPAIPRSQRSSLIDDVFEADFPRTVVSFLHLLSDNRQVSRLFGCVREYEEIYFEEFKVSRAKVVSSVELTEEEKEKLKAKLEKKSGRKVILECDTDPSLLGGITVDMDGIRMDGSIKARLATLKGVLEQ